jgi:hypothetical protein
MVCEPNIGLLLPLRDDLEGHAAASPIVVGTMRMRTDARKHVDDYMEYV